MMAIQYIPSLDIVKWSNYHNLPAYQEPLLPYDLSDLFEGIFTKVSEDIIVPEISLINYPNPFNTSNFGRSSVTNISFTIPNDSVVKLEIYNIKGQLLRTILNEEFTAGKYFAAWDGKDSYRNEVSSGIYFYRITTDKLSLSKKMMMLK